MADVFSAETGALPTWWNWVVGPFLSLFVAGSAWGVARSTQKDHARRLDQLEKDVPKGIQTIAEKMDDNHREVMRMIVNLASGRKPPPE